MDFLKRLLGQPSGEEPHPQPESELPPQPLSTRRRIQTEAEPEDFMEIGGSPVSGMTLQCVLRGHTDSINHIAWSPDGRFLATPSDDQTIRIWDVERGQCVAALENQGRAIHSVAWSPDGLRIASVSRHGRIHVHNVHDERLTVVLNSSEPSGNQVAWSPDGSMLAVTHRSNVSIWNLENKELLLTLDGLKTAVPGLSWSPSGKALAASTSQKIQIWSTADWTEIAKGSESGKQKTDQCVALGFYSIRWSHNEQIVAAGSTKPGIHIWDAQKLAVLQYDHAGIWA